MTLTFILDGKTATPEPDPVAWEAWMRSALETGARVVAQSRVNTDVTVSTVFAGIDQGPAGSPGNHRPILFETAVFESGELVRTVLHADWNEAEQAHANIVNELGAASAH